MGCINEEDIKLEAWERKRLRKIFRGARIEDGGKQMERHSSI
jgi:hypothetical protein